MQGVLCEAYRAGAVRMAGKTMVKWQDMLLRMEELDALDSGYLGEGGKAGEPLDVPMLRRRRAVFWSRGGMRCREHVP